MHSVLTLRIVLAQELGERTGKVHRIRLRASVEPSGGGEHHAGVMLAAGAPVASDAVEVACVLGDDCTPIARRRAEQLFVVQRSEYRILGYGNDVVSLVAQPASSLG